eukprot:3920088-Prorocentrum_lima.AAC.1
MMRRRRRRLWGTTGPTLIVMKPAHMPEFLGLLVDVAVDQLVHEHNLDPELELDVGLDHEIGLVHNVMNVIDE